MADAPYFHKRIIRSRSRRAGSHANGPLVASGANQDYSSEYENAGTKTHAHLDQFLRQQIVTQNDRKSQGKRSAVSAASGASLQGREVILLHSMSHSGVNLKSKWHYK